MRNQRKLCLWTRVETQLGLKKFNPRQGEPWGWKRMRNQRVNAHPMGALGLARVETQLGLKKFNPRQGEPWGWKRMRNQRVNAHPMGALGLVTDAQPEGKCTSYGGPRLLTDAQPKEIVPLGGG